MKIPTLFCAGACALLLAGGADAKVAKDKVAVHKVHRAAHKYARPEPLPPKDPYAAYWKDPGRAAPPFSYRGSP
jgi:hypothetical protein